MFIARSLALRSSIILQQIAGFPISGYSSIPIRVRAYHHAHETILSGDGSVSISRNQSASNERVICTDMEPGRKLQIRYVKQPASDFCTFIESTPKAEVVAFFRSAMKELEERRRLQDFHMKITDVGGSFRVEVYYGSLKVGPELLGPGQCISCFPDVPLYPGKEPLIEARACILHEFCDQPYVICRLDAKARPGFIITPVRHVDRMSELKDDELFALWSVAVKTLRHAELPYRCMILNHGTYRNHHHLHLKVWVASELYGKYQMKWNDQRRELWRQLQELAMSSRKKQRRLPCE